MKKLISVVALAAWLASAVGAMEVSTRFKTGEDFSSYRTYAWKARDETDAADPMSETAALGQRVRETADKIFADHGLTKVESGDADLWVVVSGFREDKLAIEGTRRQIGDSNVAWMGDPHAHSMQTYQQGTLVFEIYSAASEEKVWSAWASEGAPTIDKLRKKVEKIVRKILKDFPPK